MSTASSCMAALDKLSRAQLLEIALAGCEASSEVETQADTILAAHQRVVEGVLLSSDLLPHLLSSLQLKDGAAAAVCSQWADGWEATNEVRSHLTRVPFDFPQDLLEPQPDGRSRHLHLAVIPGDNEQLVVTRDGQRDGQHEVRILARNLSTVASFHCTVSIGSIVADEQFIYLVDSDIRVSRLTHGGTAVAPQYVLPDIYDASETDTSFITDLVLAPGGLLFCVLGHEYPADDPWDEILALDAQSLELRYRFGRSLGMNYARGMVVIREELFVCDHYNDCLQVFSLAGEHRRSITGEWKRPAELCVVEDRIYLVEEDSYQHDEEDPAGGLCDQRIYVLSLQGDTLQVYPMAARRGGCTLVCFDGKLITGMSGLGQGLMARRV